METTQIQLAIIPLLPLIGSLLAFLTGRVWAGRVATLASTLAFVLVVSLFNDLSAGNIIEVTLFDWFSVDDLSVPFALRLDALSAVMCLVVTGVGSLIHLYSTDYMAEDPAKHRFFAYLNLFMFSMLLLVLGANLMVMFVGWEGVGLCSYLLIGFWYKNKEYAAAGMKAFVVNRIGDAGFLIGIFLLYKNCQTLDFVALKHVFASHPELVAIAFGVSLSLFVGATGKSAQIPLYVWLPDAMAGPTPVSALIHAATMVTAGVYMIARLNFIFTLAPLTMAIICLVAALTAFVAATIAITQFDIKKVLAYSTVSQLGFMFLAASAGAYWVAIFHLATHAFFKACLFLGAGSVIHGCHHEQDMRNMGGLLWKMPVTAATYGISTLAIAGIFPLAGYQSKHAILEALEHMHNPALAGAAHFIPFIASITAGLTAFYMTRSFAMTFLGKYRGHAHPHESPIGMVSVLFCLALLAFFGGLFLNSELQRYLAAVLPVGEIHEVGTIADQLAHVGEGLMHSWIGLSGVLLGLVLYSGFIPALLELPRKIVEASRITTLLRDLSLNKYYIDEIYDYFIIKPLSTVAAMLWKPFDQGLIDGMVNGTGYVVTAVGEVVRTTQTGQTRHYAFLMFVSTLIMLFLYLVAV